VSAAKLHLIHRIDIFRVELRCAYSTLRCFVEGEGESGCASTRSRFFHTLRRPQDQNPVIASHGNHVMKSLLSTVDWRLGMFGATAVAAILGMEIATEPDGVSLLELLLEATELGLTIAAAVAIALMFGRLRAQHVERMALIRDLHDARRVGEDWRRQAQSHLDGLSDAIRRQFREWKLTDADAEICLLLLKGLSHREIALVRGTSEATVRQQARAAYEKSGLKGRASLCAYFLEDLLPASGDSANTGGARANGDWSVSGERAHSHSA
jgi:DNA-binding CsgD family transcriptional regulator